MDNEELQSISLKLLVQKDKNQVVFAESDHDFVDVLFSFMTIPVGAIIKLIGEKSLGCMSNVYVSVKNLDEKFLRSEICSKVLLHPRSAAEIYCRNLKVNLHDTDGNEYYECKSCDLVSYFPQNGHCRCGKPLQYKLKLPSPSPTLQGAFTESTSRFMISDDFHVRSVSTMTGLKLFQMLEAGDASMLEERTITVTKDKILELLKFSLVSKTPLSEAFLNSVPLNKSSCSFCNLDNGPGNVNKSQERFSSSTEETISLKLIINSINNTVLYAEAASDFVNLLFSFLTFPIGYLFEKNFYLPFNGCMDNVYKSINDIEDELFESPEMKEALMKSKLAPGLAQHKKLISLHDATKPTYTDFINRYKAERCKFNVNSPNQEVSITNGFVKGPSSFMVMDNLAVKPLSPVSGLCLIKEMRIPFSKIVEKEIVMGENEAIRLFTASLVSENALTDVFLPDETKQEQC